MSPWPQRNVVIVCIGLILGTVYLLTLAALLPSWISKWVQYNSVLCLMAGIYSTDGSTLWSSMPLCRCLRVLLLCLDTVTKASPIKKKHLIGAGLQLQRFGPLSSWWEAWHHAGWLGARGVKSSRSWSKDSQEEGLFFRRGADFFLIEQCLSLGALKFHLQSDTFFQQGHT